MFFTENSLSFEATVSEFAIKRFDYKSCIQNAHIKTNAVTQTIHVDADFTKCNLMIDTQFEVNLTLS